ncbi:cell division protein FtsQ/DivIB [Virgibacillus necropolis]|uniref:Cell division protein DivIB n=1 Tax=Virgibacillus necropolis TaxID=163877 RepID=A0A221ME52_9BACI|nr:FtsQ-type POTRA domain-containing protein [Virgibacillus necropolis]ASN05849.1 cell division protein FtsQ [Virgibacillus necropolis]
MSKKKVVSIEDRIPKLKQARKKKANRRLIFYLSIFFLLISIIVYLQSPLSHVHTIEVTGNKALSDKEVVEKSNLTTDTNIWMINQSEIQNAFDGNPIIDSVEVNRKLPWTVEIAIQEFKRVGYIKKESFFYPILGNGKVLSKLKRETISGDAPLLINFDDESTLNQMTTELMKLPQNIRSMISEIHWKPQDDNKNKIVLYMSDGYMVDGTIRNFAEKMKVYPSIVAQLNPKSKGIIHIGVGVYFESFEDKTKDKKIEETTAE